MVYSNHPQWLDHIFAFATIFGDVSDFLGEDDRVKRHASISISGTVIVYYYARHTPLL